MKRKFHDLRAEMRFLEGILNKTTTQIQHLDTQTNILIGISSAIFAFTTAGMRSGLPSRAQMILVSFSAIAALTGLFAIHPPRFMRKKGQKESLLYSKEITSCSSDARYCQKLLKVLDSREEILKQYSKEIYNLTKYYYQPKWKLFRLSRNILLLGVILSAMSSILFP